MQKLTNSMRNKFASCHRAYQFAYVELMRPLVPSEALSFGTAMHALLENYWGGSENPAPTTGDAFKDMTLQALFEGYVNRWFAEDEDRFDKIAAEVGFQAPLMNPETGGISKTWEIAGKIDAIAKEKGSDVIRKPTIKPYKATPEDKRKYNKDGSLSKTCREFDETPEEWYERLKADIAERPDYYYARVEVARSADDLTDYLFDMWAVGREIADAERLGRFSRNPQSCSAFGKCEYFDVCSGCASLDDVSKARKKWI